MQKINEASSMQKFVVKKKQTVRSILQQLKLEENYFAVLVNGEEAEKDFELDKDDEVLILPKIAGG